MELPEVEVLRRDLEKEATGRRIESAEVRSSKNSMKLISRHHRTRKDFTKRLEGRKFVRVERRGKYLILVTDDDQALVVHFGMSGRFLKGTKRQELDQHTHVYMEFARGGDLRYIDPRALGRLFVVPVEELGSVRELQRVGVDPLEHSFTWPQFSEALAARKMKLKQLLMDQEFISGLGNIYSDEVLFAAGLRYDRRSDDLSSQEVRRLYRAIQETVQEAIRDRGTTLEDEAYLDLFGKPGDHRDNLNVYGRKGLPCRRCRTPIETVRISNRGAYYCPVCQT
ncbi:MAG TPA: bifunctional DNA-formamidopyrimidine glycosylase/DNA-(apurinic or apyrimidinic site) lyase [Actinomycetota bacterium]